ncbi:Ger(x)C family spore germination protein [Paenibacillus qinlingensis]|uniref:Ger(x)C family spore germination protein n=1 Tax=Paenibacillus qinlingensis TaxID=1837343 RepID=UPI001564014F|nr:Ger(x)C family spore germination protein [Paenibacillus qinlingensis]NQX62123.1 Ger(x)C family spore germination protein [Paenibacillus qinlingensis]
MRWLMVTTLSGLLLFSLTGCWNKAELVEYAFVQAVSLDLSDKGNIKLTTLFYKPSGSSALTKGTGTKSSFTIKTEGKNVFDAIRDVTIHLGRKAKWDHMRAILVSDEVLKAHDLGVILDFFRRDHEPRPTNLLLVTKGNAGEYLQLEPFIEYTLGQQLRSMDEGSSRFAAKSMNQNILKVMIQMKSETGIAEIPYLYLNTKRGSVPNIAGVVVIKKQKMVDIIPPEELKAFLLLKHQFKGGIILTSCEELGGDSDHTLQEAFEISQGSTNVSTSLKNNAVIVNIKAKLVGAAGELSCSTINTAKEELAYKTRLSNQIKNEILTLIHHLQSKKLDALGIGNMIYAKNPRLWQSWKQDWGDRFTDVQFNIQVDVTVTNSGMSGGKPLDK